jgi:hypothetical protein
MKRRDLIFGGVLAASVAFGQPPAAARDRAAEALAAARHAIGGRQLDGLKTLSVEATMRRNLGAIQTAAEVEMLIELPDKYLRTDVISGGPMGRGFSIGFNGVKPLRPAGSALLPGGGMVIRMGAGPAGPPPGEALSAEDQAGADALMLRSTRAEVSRMMLGWLARALPALDAGYSYAGEAESPDGKAHVIDVTAADGFRARLFIDQKTSLPLMVTYRAPLPRIVTGDGPGGRAAGEAGRGRMRPEGGAPERESLLEPSAMADFTIYFDDWRDIGGLRFPHTMRRAADGVTSEEWAITRVKVNPKLDAAKFKS